MTVKYNSGTLTFNDGTTQTAAIYGFGVGQSWQNVAGARGVGNYYYNTTNNTIMVSIVFYAGNTSSVVELYVDNIRVSKFFNNPNKSDIIQTVWGIVPPGSSYIALQSNSAVSSWNELR